MGYFRGGWGCSIISSNSITRENSGTYKGQGQGGGHNRETWRYLFIDQTLIF